MHRLIQILGGIAVLVLSFFGTLYVLNLEDTSWDAQRAAHIAALQAALEKYRADTGKYPAPFHDNPVSDLMPPLVGGGYLEKIPVDTYWTMGRLNQYRYRSDGNTYGVLVHREVGPCVVGVGTEGSGWWKQPPKCPF